MSSSDFEKLLSQDVNKNEILTPSLCMSIISGETFSMKYDNFSVIYPNYLDSNKTVKLGRRISAKDAVPEPTVQDIHEALASLNVRHVIQPNKGYSRDAISRWDNLGRVLVDMEGAVEKGVVGVGKDGAYDLDDIPDMNDDDNDKENNNEPGRGGGKKQLIRQIALIIPTLSGRQKRVEEKAKAAEAEKLKLAKAEKAAAPSKPSKGSGGSGSSSKKKKGKKKK